MSKQQFPQQCGGDLPPTGQVKEAKHRRKSVSETAPAWLSVTTAFRGHVTCAGLRALYWGRPHTWWDAPPWLSRNSFLSKGPHVSISHCVLEHGELVLVSSLCPRVTGRLECVRPLTRNLSSLICTGQIGRSDSHLLTLHLGRRH